MTDLLPDALADALGRVVSDCRKEWLKEIDRIGAEARAVVAELKAENAGMRRHYHEVVATYSARVDAALAQIKDGAPGRDGQNGVDGKEGPPGRDGFDGKSVALEEISPLIEAEVGKAVSALPSAKDGRDGEPGAKGADGKDAEPIQMAEIVIMVGEAVHEWVQANPPVEGKAGRDGADGKDGALGDRGLPGEPGRDGRDGLPGVPGTNGEKGRDGIDGKDGAAGLHGKDGTDGLGFDDMTVEHDGERTITLRFVQGAKSLEFPITMPIVLDKGVYRDGQTYQRGDGVSWAGSFWIAQDETAEKPDTGKGWRMAVKRGRDGKEGPQGKPWAPPPVVRADR